MQWAAPWAFHVNWSPPQWITYTTSVVFFFFSSKSCKGRKAAQCGGWLNKTKSYYGLPSPKPEERVLAKECDMRDHHLQRGENQGEIYFYALSFVNGKQLDNTWDMSLHNCTSFLPRANWTSVIAQFQGFLTSPAIKFAQFSAQIDFAIELVVSEQGRWRGKIGK